MSRTGLHSLHCGRLTPHHASILEGHDGGTAVPARIPGGGKLKPIEDAPGSYVKVKG